MQSEVARECKVVEPRYDHDATVSECGINFAVGAKADQAALISDLPCRHDLAITLQRDRIGRAIIAVIAARLETKDSSRSEGLIQMPGLCQG